MTWALLRRRPAADPRPLHPGRVLGRARAPDALLPVLAPHARRDGAGRGRQLPLRQQEPDRVDGRRGPPRVQDRPDRRAGPAARARARRRRPPRPWSPRDEPHAGAAGARPPQLHAGRWRERRPSPPSARRRSRRARSGAVPSASATSASAARDACSSRTPTRATRRSSRCATSTRRTSRRPTSRWRRPASSRLPHYSDWKEMIQKEKLEGVVIAPPLFMHADLTVGCMEAGLHVLCEKMMAWDDASCQRMLDAARQDGQGPRDRPPALLQPDLPGGLRRHRQERHARRGLPRAARVAPQRQLAAQGRPALARLRPRRSGATRRSITWSTGGSTSSTRAATWPSSRATWSRSPTGSSARGRGGRRQRRRLPLQGRPRGARPHLRHDRVPGRPHRGLHLDRVERLRPLLRGVLRHEGHARPARRDRGVPLRRGRRRRGAEGHDGRGRVEGRGAGERRVGEPLGRCRGRRAGRRRGRRAAGRPPGGVPLRGRRLLLGDPRPARRSSAVPRRPWPRPAPASPGFEAIDTKQRVALAKA